LVGVEAEEFDGGIGADGGDEFVVGVAAGFVVRWEEAFGEEAVEGVLDSGGEFGGCGADRGELGGAGAGVGGSCGEAVLGAVEPAGDEALGPDRGRALRGVGVEPGLGLVDLLVDVESGVVSLEGGDLEVGDEVGPSGTDLQFDGSWGGHGKRPSWRVVNF